MPHPGSVDADFELIRSGNAFYDGLLAGLPDDEFAGPSLLPSWSRGHVVAHVALNALALTRLVRWAATGVQTPMYPSAAARDADIRAHASWPPARLRQLHRDAGATLASAWLELPAAGWSAPVRANNGGDVPGSATVWMRVREVWLHGVDLASGGSFDDFPPVLLDRLLADSVEVWADRGDATGLVMDPTDRPFDVPGPGTPSTTVRGTAAELTRWATGRGDPAVTVAGGPGAPAPRWR